MSRTRDRRHRAGHAAVESLRPAGQHRRQRRHRNVRRHPRPQRAELQKMMRDERRGHGLGGPRRRCSSSGAHPGAGGDVVVVASVAGLRGGADEAVYAATKFAQVGLCRRARSRGPARRDPGHHDLPRRRSHRVRDRRRPHRGRPRTRRLPATRGRRPRGHHRAATAAAGSYDPVAAVEHGAEQLTPPGRRRLGSRRTGSTAARPRHARAS